MEDLKMKNWKLCPHCPVKEQDVRKDQAVMVKQGQIFYAYTVRATDKCLFDNSSPKPNTIK